MYGTSLCNGLKVTIQIGSRRGTGKRFLLLPAEDEFEKQEQLSFRPTISHWHKSPSNDPKTAYPGASGPT